MSFVFEWDKLDDEVALQIEGMIHAHFQRISKPAFMGNIAVSKFRFGSTPPSITVLDVTDPLEEWYVHMDQEEARLAQEAAEAGGGESMDEDELASGEEGADYEDDYSYSADGSIVMVGEGDDIEYLDSGTYDDRERLETQAWLHQEPHYNGSSSGDSYKEEIRGGQRSSSGMAVYPKRTNSRHGNQGFNQDSSAQTMDRYHDFKSAVASPTKGTPPSSVSSASSSGPLRSNSTMAASGRRGMERENLYYAGSQPTYSRSAERNSRNLTLETETNLSGSTKVLSSSPSTISKISSTNRLSLSHSLSSHDSDEEIESEAFYTQGESTIYQTMKSLNLEPSNPLSPKPFAAERGDVDGYSFQKQQQQQHQHGSPYFPTTPGGASGSTGGGIGLGFNVGIGSSPGSVLSSVMQNRSSTRSLSAASFYSSPTSATVGPSGTPSGQHPQLHFPDLSGMVVSGNSLLGLRAGTPSRTIPGTPRGFESPTMAFSRRESFSDTAASHPRPAPTEERPTELDSHHPSGFMSPVEALSFDAFSQQPKVVERLKDAEDERDGRGIYASPRTRSFEGDQRSRNGSVRHTDHQHLQSSQRGENAERRSHKKHGTRGYDQRESPATVSLPTAPSKRHENDIQLLLSVNYQGQMGFTVETELLLNYPTFAFLTLPVKLVITGFSFKAKVLMGYLRDHVNVCFLEPEDPTDSILSSVRIESQVGDEQKQAVLKNVGKIERFVVEQLRKFITEDFVYPSYHSIELQRAPPSDSPNHPGNVPSVSHPTSTTSLPSHSTAAASTATNRSNNAAGIRKSATTSGERSGRPSSIASRGSMGSIATHSHQGRQGEEAPLSRARSYTASSMSSSYPRQ
ncbi:Mitochondrial distribution and morphology protein 12 [Haplosporangium sp. Z 11]|nr:Mitochondrial distribution and morphology protein 12 [Haplosporangium sp. Z 11]